MSRPPGLVARPGAPVPKPPSSSQVPSGPATPTSAPKPAPRSAPSRGPTSPPVVAPRAPAVRPTLKSREGQAAPFGPRQPPEVAVTEAAPTSLRPEVVAPSAPAMPAWTPQAPSSTPPSSTGSSPSYQPSPAAISYAPHVPVSGQVVYAP